MPDYNPAMKLLVAPIGCALLLCVSVAPDKPKLTLKANPVMAFSPARIVVSGELSGGANDDQQYYCPSVEWEWGDGTTSQQSADCEPFEAGKSEIKRHFAAEHTYRLEGEQNTPGQPGQPDYRDFRIQLRLKKSGKVVMSASTTVKIKPEMNAIEASRRP